MNTRFLVTAIGAVLLLFVATSTAVAQGASVYVTGELDVILAEDFETGESTLHYNVLDHKNNKAYRVKFDKKPKDGLMSGARVKIRGKVEGDDFVVLDGSSPDDFTVTEDAPIATDARRVAVIVVNFQDASVDCSNEEIANLVFADPAQNFDNGCVSNFFDESSFGGLSLNSDTDGDGARDVFGPFQINVSISSACDYYSWAYEAEDMATAAGIDLSLYQHLQFVIPPENPCSWGGVANVGCGTQCRSWIAYCDRDNFYSHEFGHNLGMRHAATDTNNDGVTESAYGDSSDVMGLVYAQPNAPHKEQMGWFDAYPERIVDIGTGGTFYVAPLEVNPWDTSLPQVLKVPKPGTSDHYYFSYRVRTGWDGGLQDAYANKLNVHRFRGSGSTYFIRALNDGEQFADGDFTISVVSHNTDPLSGYIEVQVETAGTAEPVCSLEQQSVSFDTASWTASAGGATLDYDVRLTNNDSSACGSSVFNLTPTLPSGWTVSVSPNSVTLQPGASVTAVMSVTSPIGTEDGSYAVNVRASDSSNSHGDVSASGTYVINSAPPESVTDLTASIKRKTKVALNWSATYDGAGQLIDTYDVYRDLGTGFVLVATASASQFTDSSTVSGVAYRYCVTAVDDAGTLSGSSNIVSITVGGGGGGSNKGGNGKGRNK